MIKKVSMFSLTCSNCGELLGEEDGVIAWESKESLLTVANDSGWGTIIYPQPGADKHYCPECYEYDDNGNIICK